jgi:hypothetical protein
MAQQCAQTRTVAGGLVRDSRHAINTIAGDYSFVVSRLTKLPGDLLLLAIFPFALMAINNSWTFLGPINAIDPFIFTGYFVYLEDNMKWSPPPYQASRLPWILLGHVVYWVAEPEQANLALRLILFYTSVVSLYVAVRSLWQNRLAATIAALLLGFNTSFLFAIFWDYVDGPGVAAIMATLACLSAGPRSRFPLPVLFVGGFFMTVFVSVNILLVIVLPLLATWYLSLCFIFRRSLLETLGGGVVFLIGGAAGLVLFGLINHHLIGEYNYLQPQIDAATNGGSFGYDKIPITQAVFLVWPFIGSLVGLSLITVAGLQWRTRKTIETDVKCGVVAAVHLLAIFAIFIVLHLSDSTEILSYAYYTSYLLPFVFMSLGAGIAITLSRVRLMAALQMLIGAAVIVILAAPFLTEQLRPLPGCPPNCLESTRTTALAITVGVLFLVLVLQRNIKLMLPVLFLFAVLNVGVGSTQGLFFDKDTRGARLNKMLIVFDAERALRPYDRDNKVLYWFDAYDPNGPVFTGMAAMHVWSYRMVEYQFPRMQPHTPALGNRIAIPTSKEPLEIVDAANAALAERNLHYAVKNVVPVRRGEDSFNILVGQVEEGTRGPSPMVEVAPLDVTRFGGYDGKVRRIPTGVEVQTPPATYGYGGALRVPQELRDKLNASGRIDVLLNVKQGPVSVGLTNKAETLVTTHELVLNPQENLLVSLPVSKFSDLGSVIIRAWEQPTVAIVEVSSVRVYIRSPQ